MVSLYIMEEYKLIGIYTSTTYRGISCISRYTVYAYSLYSVIVCVRIYRVSVYSLYTPIGHIGINGYT